MLTERPRPSKGISLRTKYLSRRMSNLRARCSIEASTIKNSGALMPNELENKMYITKKARFNAAQRIFLTQRCLNMTITAVSIFQILISLVLIINKEAAYQNILTCFTIISSIFILVISNSSILNNGTKEAYIMHKCGLAIGKLYDELRFANANEADISRRYDETLIEYDINHENIDKNLAIASINADYRNTQKKIAAALESNHKKAITYIKYNILYIINFIKYIFYYIINWINIILPDILFMFSIAILYIILNYLLTRSGSELDLIGILSKL